MATLTPQFFELLEADQKEIFFQHLNLQEEKWPRLFGRQNSTKAYEDRMRIGGLGTLQTKAEGAPIAYDDPIQGARVRTVHTTYGLGWRATMEMMQDDQHAVMNRMSAELGLSAHDHRERLAWSLIDDGFTGTTYTILEGEALFSATHANLKAGGTQSNILSPAVALGVTGLEALMTLAMVTTDDSNRFIDLQQALLVHHPNLVHQAYVLLNTDKEVDTNNNNVSTVESSRTGLTSLSVPYLSSTTAWSIHAPPGDNSLMWNDRMDLDFAQSGDSNTRDRLNDVVYRASVMGSEWRGNFGSNF